MRWYKASLNMAHQGAGKALDETIYIQAPDLVAAYEVARRLPGCKKSRTGSFGNTLEPAGKLPTGCRKWYWRKR